MGLKNFSILTQEPYNNNLIFSKDSTLNRDDCLSSFRLLKNNLYKVGYDCNTHDIYEKKNVLPDIMLFIDVNKQNQSYFNEVYKNVNKYLLLQECEVVKKENWIIENLAKYKKVFTWNDKLVDNSKYIKLNFANNREYVFDYTNINKDKFCVMIASNKFYDHPYELYSQRIKTIEWFQNNCLHDLDLYGFGWDDSFENMKKALYHVFKNKIFKNVQLSVYPSYKGAIKNKLSVLKDYKFSICYENAQGFEGYITEKIFDCFKSYCVPVYWGAPNIDHYIPSNCYINRLDFDSHEQLYETLKNMNDNDYKSYQKNIYEYMNSGSFKQFTNDNFVEVIINETIDRC